MLATLLAAALALAPSGGAENFLPSGFAPGLHRTRPLVTPVSSRDGSSAIHGFTCFGAGQAGAQNAALDTEAIYADHATVLAVAGQPGDAAITLRGGYATLGRLAIRGEGPGVGLRVVHRGRINGGKHLAEGVSFRDFPRAAIEIGDADQPGRPGNDNFTGERLHVARCGSLIRVVSPQAMDTTIDVAHVRESASVVWLEGGADVTIEELNVDCKTPLVVIDGDKRKFGPNNGSFTLDGVKFDDTPGTVVLLDERTDVWMLGWIEKPWFPARALKGEIGVRATLKGRDTRVVIRDAINWPPDCAIDLQDGAEFVVENADLLSLPPDWDPDGGGRFVIRDCTYQGGRLSGTW